MLTSIEIAALDLAVELEEAIRAGNKLPTDVILALNRLRQAQQKQQTATEELENLWEVAMRNRSSQLTQPDNVVRLHKPKLIKNEGNDIA